MSRNIEIKARIDNVQALSALAASFADEGPIDLVQDDTFFRCDNGRLKLRAFPNGTGELIYYRRPDQYGPKESFYLRSPTSAPDSLRESLSLAYGEVGHVSKRRVLFRVGRTRVHLDSVEGLIVSATFILAEDADFAGMNEEWVKWFSKDPPARQGAKLPVRPKAIKVSIAAIAEENG